MKILTSMIAAIFSFSTLNAAVLIEEKGRKVNRSYVKLSDNGLQFRDLRKVGVGLGFVGIHGLMGVDLHLNFTPTVTFSTGYGLSRGFNGLHMQIKKVIAGDRFLPYIAGGLAQWYSRSGEPLESSSPSFFRKKFLTSSERNSGNFRENILFPAIGIEYLNLKGEYAGVAFYFELLMLIDLDDFVSEATSGIGMNYYF